MKRAAAFLPSTRRWDGGSEWLTAEVFLAVIRSAHGYRASRGSVVGWLYGVARNVVSTERRRRAREYRGSGIDPLING